MIFPRGLREGGLEFPLRCRSIREAGWKDGISEEIFAISNRGWRRQRRECKQFRGNGLNNLQEKGLEVRTSTSDKSSEYGLHIQWPFHPHERSNVIIINLVSSSRRDWIILGLQPQCRSSLQFAVRQSLPWFSCGNREYECPHGRFNR